MKKTLSVLVFLASVSALAGGGSSVGGGNPAVVNCYKLGGTTETVQTSQGQDTNCVIEEWTLFRAMDKRGLVTPHNSGSHGMPNPAAVNCIDISGNLRTVDTSTGPESYCVIEEWALFHVINVLK